MHTVHVFQRSTSLSRCFFLLIDPSWIPSRHGDNTENGHRSIRMDMDPKYRRILSRRLHSHRCVADSFHLTRVVLLRGLSGNHAASGVGKWNNMLVF